MLHLHTENLYCQLPKQKALGITAKNYSLQYQLEPPVTTGSFKV